MNRLRYLAVMMAFLGLAAPSFARQDEAADDARERKVMERFLTVLEKAPRRGTALDRVYGYHVERGSLDPFLKRYQDRVQANPKDGASWLVLGLVEAQRGKDAAAVEAFRKAETVRADDPMPSYYLGQALVLVGQPDVAVDAFERALARKPARADLLDIYQALGRVHQRAHRDDRALAVWDRLEKAFPDDPRVQEQIAHALADESQDAPALKRFEALTKGTKDKFRQVQFAMEAAELKVKLGKAPDALADFESLLGKLDPESWLYREVRRKVEEVFLRTDDLAGLASYYERWIKKVPDDVEAMSRLGRTLANQGRVAEARKWFDEAVKLAPSRRELRLALIEQLTQEKKVAEAASQYEALAKLEPNNPDVVRDWGRMLLRDTSKPEADRKNAAVAVWSRLAPDDSKDAVTVAQAADLYRQANFSDEAIALYQKAIKLAPESSQYREYLGEYYHALKRPADALSTWRMAVEGKNRNARTLGRLGEVLAGFGYRKEAVEPMVEACKLEPDDFDLRLRLADLRLALEDPNGAMVELDKAATVAAAEEQAEAVLERQIKAYQSTGTLVARIDSLRNDMKTSPTAAGWTRLARLLEAEGKPPEAAAAIVEATKIDPKSIPAWVTTARLRESAGDILGSVDALRTLTTIDRRSRTDYLTGIAKLEARLGRRGPALDAGRELLAAAPGNPDNHQFFAELCFSLNEPDEGLDALRRAARANPSDPKAMLTLAENLARQFRTEEAIELFWRAFGRTTEVDAKLGIVARLADQYLQRNQLDRLIGRLERELREPNQQRELSLCLAQAHSASGDYATARLELERLLAANARDGHLLVQLSNLAEQEGDLSSAAKYQKQALDIAPNAEATGRLAALYLKAGEVNEAEGVWSRLATENQEPARVMAAVDNLLTQGKHASVLAITERMLLKQPGDWEALYREGVALEALGKPAEAIKRFQSLLDLRLKDDDLSTLAKARQRNPNPATPGQPAATTTSTASRKLAPPTFPIQGRMNVAYQVRSVTKLDADRVFYGGTTPTTWTPGDFGQARMAAIGWIYALGLKEEKPDAAVQSFRESRDKAGADPRAYWDFYYLQLVRFEGGDVFEAARALVKAQPADLSAEYAYLNSLFGRSSTAATRNTRTDADVDKTPALAGDDLDLALASYRDFRKRKPDTASATLMGYVNTELKRAKRGDEVDRFYRESIASAEDVNAVDAAMTLVADRGDVDALFALQEKSDRLRAGKAAGPANGFSPEHPDLFAQVMNKRADEKAYGDVARVLDRHIALIRSPDSVARRAKAGGSNANGRMNYTMRLGKKQTYVNIEYPLPNAYFSSGSISLLRNAYELYKRDDLTSDLLAHLKAEAAKAAEGDRTYPLLALGYVEWWNDDKDEAIRDLALAAESAKGDVDLRLGLAELQAKRGEPAEALELVDAVEPTDQKTVQRREVLALRLAVLAGDVERARKASERLFGLRLDADTQIQLAAQMNQLGMHELAEAVLARARRRAGGNTSALVALMLQYQRQGKTDTAFQVANQILKAGSNKAFSPYQNNNDDSAQREAIQVFARSGKLKELIDRAEAQLKAAPNSFQVLQSLGDYYKAAGDKEKSKATYDRLAKLRPDDAKLRFQIANKYVQDGDYTGSIEHFTAAIKKEPSLYVYQYWQIEQAYQQAGKLDELARLFDEVDLKVFNSNPWALQQIISTLFQDEKTKELGLKLFRKAWKTMPDSRSNLIANMDGDAIWALPEIYDNVREAVIPAAGKTNVQPWNAVDQIYSYMGDGKVTGIVSRLMETSAKQNKLDLLGKEVDEGLKRFPEWSGGRALKAVILLRRGKVDEGKAALELLMATDKEIPSEARMIIGQELDGIKPVAEIQLKLYQGAVEDENNGMEYQWGPAKRLVTLYHEASKDSEARDLVLKYARKPSNRYAGNGAAYMAYQKLSSALIYGLQMAELGFPADAVRFFDEVLGDPEGIAAARPYSGNQDYFTQQARTGLDRALKGLNAKNLARTLKVLVPAPPEKDKPAAPVDLVLIVNPKELDKAAITSLFGEALRSAVKAKQSATIDEVKATLARRLEVAPRDLSTAIAVALVAAAEGDSDAIARASARLVEWVESSPLDPIDAGARPNARQRAEALGQVGLWLVAVEALKHDPSKKSGAILEARALEAARRQPDARWSLAMLREGGQAAIDRGDRAAAEALWRLMLKQVLAPPSPPKAKKPPASPATAKPKVGDVRRLALVLVAVAQVPAIPTPPQVVTLERFEQAAQMAVLAAEHEMFALSAEAVRDSLGGGPPVVPISLDANANRNRNQPAEADPSAARVEERLARIDAAWTKHKAPPMLAYEALRSAVLPEGRPGEVFLFPRPLSMGNNNPFVGNAAGGEEKPRSVGLLLALRAVEAGQVADLRRRIEARQGQPLAFVPARVLDAQLAIVSKDDALAAKILDSLADRLKTDVLQSTAELACHAALPAFDLPLASARAMPIVEVAVKTLATSGNAQVVGPLTLTIARRKFKDMKPAEGKASLLSYLEKMEDSSVRYGGDYSLYFRKQNLATVAGEFAKAGQLADTWEMLGRFADAPSSKDYGIDPNLGSTLTRALKMIVGRPAAERYALLKDWSMPTDGRKSVRVLASFAPEDKAIPPRFGPMPHVALGGIAATPTLLIDAAREAGKLDDLVAEARKASEAKVENAATLLALLQIATGKGPEAGATVRARLDVLKKPAPAEGNQNRRGSFQRTTDWPDFLLAHASMADVSLTTPFEEFTRRLIDQSQTNQNTMFLGRLRRDLALHQSARAGTLASPAGPDPGLAHWRSLTIEPAYTHAAGSMESLWAESEGLVSHLAGPSAEFLFLDYPLAGTFEVDVDTFLGTWSEGQISLDGLVFDPDDGGSIYPVSRHESRPASDRFRKPNEYNRVTIRVEPGKLQVFLNGHLFYREADPASASPWLALHTSSGRRSAFRNISIRGDVEIPREVRMLQGDRLDGWASGFYNETQPPRLSLGQKAQDQYGGTVETKVGDLKDYDYHAKDGVLVGRRLDEASRGKATIPSRIYYHRPIRDGESITYDFRHEPGVMVHPSLDRLAFLIEPDGVKLRWITDGGEDDWTDLPPGNTVDAPECRRGPARLPLKPGDWNSAKVAIEAGTVNIDLNGVRIFESPIEPANQRVFGFYHDKARTSVKVKDVVLRGNWPDKLPLGLLDRRDPNPSSTDRLARHALVDERFALMASDDVLSRARRMPPTDRYASLSAYVLPALDHATFRLRGDLTPADPAPGTSAAPGSGGDLEGPAIELVATAKTLGKLDDLIGQVEAAPATDDPARRGKLAMIAIVQAARGLDLESARALESLKPLLATIADDEPESARWPELVAASATLDRPTLHGPAMALLEVMDEQWRKKAVPDWNRIVRATRARGRLLAQAGRSTPVLGWAPFAHGNAASRGRGLPQPTWTFADGSWTHNAGHRRDNLYLATPLRGDFEVECDLTSFDWRETQLSYAATAVALQWEKKSYHLLHFGRIDATNAIDPPIAEVKPWYHFRLVVKDGIYSAFVDGRKIHDQKLPDDPDPWLAITTSDVLEGGARNIKVTGKPVIPDAIPLSTQPNLAGWLNDYYDDPLLWKKEGDEIVGPLIRDPASPDDEEWTSRSSRRNPSPQDQKPLGTLGSKQESVLKYHRPLVEDGEVAYEFFHEPGKVMVHPSLDRLAFLIEPDGVKLHWITDAQHDRTGLAPDNATVEPDRRRGPTKLPLRPGDWNRLKLSIVGDVVKLTLNDVEIYERPLESTNRRDFGLFRFADETEARVRAVVHRGQWPRTLPAAVSTK